MYVSAVRLETARQRVAAQKAVVARLPNVSAVDVELVLQSLQQIVDRIARVIQFMALFSIGVGLVILGGAIAVTKFQRLRESVLLRTLGATRAAVAAVLSAEYALLGAMAGLVGALAAGGLSWGLVTFVFDGRWDLRLPPYLAAAASAALLTTAIGLAANLDILNRKPMHVLREE
jgi:putative ABC transport system permease protein